jgi:hypothetical protein
MTQDNLKLWAYWLICSGHLVFTVAYYAWHFWHGRPH